MAWRRQAAAPRSVPATTSWPRTAPRCGACSRRSSTSTPRTATRCRAPRAAPPTRRSAAGLTARRQRPDHLPPRARLRGGGAAPPLRSREALVRARVAGPRRDREGDADDGGRPAAGAARRAARALGGGPPLEAGRRGRGGRLPRPQRASLTPEQAKKRIEALRAELEKAKVAEKLQYQLDGLQSKLFKLEEALKGGAKIREGLEKAEAARAEVEVAAELAAKLGDAEAKLAAYEKATARHEDAQAKVAAEREALAEAEGAGAPTPFWTEPLFWAGAGGGVVVAAAALLGASSFPDLRYLALLDIGAFGWAAGSRSAGSGRSRNGSGSGGAGGSWTTGRRRSRRSTTRTGWRSARRRRRSASRSLRS